MGIGCSSTEIMGLNPTRGKDVCIHFSAALSCVGRCLDKCRPSPTVLYKGSYKMSKKKKKDSKRWQKIRKIGRSTQ
jgi:hypothetical protein